MPVQLIDRIKQRNGGNFYLTDAVGVEYNRKSLIDALKAGDIIPVRGGTSAGMFHVASINIDSNTAFDSSRPTPNTVSAGDLVVDANGVFYTVVRVDGTTVAPFATLTADGGGTFGFKGAKGDKGEPGAQGPAGPQGLKGGAFTIAKAYASVAEMNIDYRNADIPTGSFVVISTTNVSDVDNAKMFTKNDTQYAFVANLPGARGIQDSAGPQGIQGPRGEPDEQGEKGANDTLGAKSGAGQRGNRITVGDGDPGGPPADALAGDVYINQANGDFYQVQDQ